MKPEEPPSGVAEVKAAPRARRSAKSAVNQDLFQAKDEAPASPRLTAVAAEDDDVPLEIFKVGQRPARLLAQFAERATAAPDGPSGTPLLSPFRAALPIRQCAQHLAVPWQQGRQLTRAARKAGVVSTALLCLSDAPTLCPRCPRAQIESAVKMSPRPPSQQATPSTAPSSKRADPASPATGIDAEAVRPRRLSMRPEVQEAADVPLPDADSPTDVKVAAAIPIPSRYTTPRKAFSPLSILVTITLTLALTAGAGYLLCNTTLPPNLQTPVQPYCGQAAALVQRAAVAQADLRAQAQAQWSRASAAAQSRAQAIAQETRGQAAALATRASAVAQQLREQAAALPDQARALVSKYTQRSPPVVHQMLPVVIPASAFYSMVHQAPGLPLVEDIYTMAHYGNKAVAVLLDCGDHCGQVLQELLTAVQLPQHMLHVAGGEFSEPGSAGTLQTQLATFLKHNSHGVVVISGLETMSLDALSVLNNAMSEGGSLQLNGKAVPSHSAFYVALFGAHEGVAAAVRRQVDAIESGAKAVLQQRVTAALSAGAHDAPGVALALRRRFDFVLPATAAVDAAIAAAASAATQESHVLDTEPALGEAQPEVA